MFSNLNKSRSSELRPLPTLWIGLLCLAQAVLSAAETVPSAPDLFYWGIPRSESYYPRETGISARVRSIATLPEGEMAFLSSTGVHTFDGTNWSIVPGIAEPSATFTLPDGRFIVSGIDGLTAIEADGKGSYTTELLTPPDKYSFKQSGLENFAFARGYLFGHFGYDLFIFGPDGAIQHHKLANWATSCFAIGDEIYVTGGADSLLNRWDWEKQELVDTSEFLAGSGLYEWIVYTAPRAEGGVWAVTNSSRILGFDGSTTWQWPGNEVLSARHVTVKSLKEISPAALAIGSAGQGIFVFSAEGKIEFELSKQQGLYEGHVNEIGTDNQGGLWSATQNSLNHVANTTRSTVYDDSHGIIEEINCIQLLGDKVYLGTKNGLFVNDPSATKMGDVFKAAIPIGDFESLLAYRDTLFVPGRQSSTIDIHGEISELGKSPTNNFFQPKSHPNVLLAGNHLGIVRFDYHNGSFVETAILAGPETSIYSIAENDAGELFGSLGDNRYARIYLEDRGGRFDIHDLPQRKDDTWSFVVTHAGEAYINSTPYCLKWDSNSQSFVEDSEIKYYVGDAPFGFEQVYGSSSQTSFVALNARSSITVPRPSPEIIGVISSIGNAIDTRATCIAYDNNGGVWAGGAFGIIHSLLPETQVDVVKVIPRIHSITSLRDGGNLSISATADAPIILEHQQNSLHVKAEFPQFTAASHHLYRIFLEGFDSDFPPFSDTSFREFTNLAPGSYTLKIGVRDAGGHDSYANDFNFTILPPWYGTPYAYALYFVSAVLLVGLIVYAYNRNQIRKSRELQALVKERTQEIRNQNAELEHQAQRLERQNEELEQKTEELTATTHTLTDTLHQLQQMQDQLVATARTAGKAEIAINVLHNVGNVLNSINVSINFLSDKVSKSKAFKLIRLAELVDSRKSDINAFLTQDPRGKAVPEYLIHISQALGEEVRSVQHELGIMEEDIDHVKNIISAQQTHAKSQSIVEPINIRDLCQSALAILGSDQLRSQLEIIQEIPPDIVIQSDKHRLLEIVLNLISNAQDAIKQQKPEIGLITLSAEAKPDEQTILLQVQDNGSGIDPETQAKLFQHGFTTKQDGHGFGLHSSANAAHTLGGSLAISSPGVGQGATAILTLPLANAAKQPSDLR